MILNGTFITPPDPLPPAMPAARPALRFQLAPSPDVVESLRRDLGRLGASGLPPGVAGDVVRRACRGAGISLMGDACDG